MIEINISDGLFGQKRKVKFEGINMMSLSRGFAEIEFLLYQFDNQGELLQSPDLRQARSVVSPLSDANHVDPQTGITLPEGETGAPEFTWWWTMAKTVPIPTLIEQAIQILDSQGRFDRQ